MTDTATDERSERASARRRSAHNFKDRRGERFGRLVVIERASNALYGQARWSCRCDCGRFCVVVGNNLVNGNSKSCGCLRHTYNGASQRHGEASHKNGKSIEYRTWSRMLARCQNPRNASFDRYGGRGIAVCKRWTESFEDFLADMGRRPGPGFSLDRINNDANYEPGNCRWATAAEQARNRHPRRSAK